MLARSTSLEYERKRSCPVWKHPKWGKLLKTDLGLKGSQGFCPLVSLFSSLFSPLVVFGTTSGVGWLDEDGSFVVCLLIPQRIYIFPLTSFVKLVATAVAGRSSIWNQTPDMGVHVCKSVHLEVKIRGQQEVADHRNLVFVLLFWRNTISNPLSTCFHL